VGSTFIRSVETRLPNYTLSEPANHSLEFSAMISQNLMLLFTLTNYRVLLECSTYVTAAWYRYICWWFSNSFSRLACTNYTPLFSEKTKLKKNLRRVTSVT